MLKRAFGFHRRENGNQSQSHLEIRREIIATTGKSTSSLSLALSLSPLSLSLSLGGGYLTDMFLYIPF